MDLDALKSAAHMPGASVLVAGTGRPSVVSTPLSTGGRLLLLSDRIVLKLARSSDAFARDMCTGFPLGREPGRSAVSRLPGWAAPPWSLDGMTEAPQISFCGASVVRSTT